LRINGIARILADADYFAALAVQGKRPILVLEIDLEQVFWTRRPGIRQLCLAAAAGVRILWHFRGVSAADARAHGE
jgi:hypothetical protein